MTAPGLYEFVRVERDEHITIVTLNRPDDLKAHGASGKFPQLPTSLPAIVRLLASSDVTEGPLAFPKKRPPRWESR